MTTSEISLTKYLQKINIIMRKEFSQSLWVFAEITDCKENRGNYYLELADKQKNSEILSKCKANIWASTASSIVPDFEKNTGIPFKAGLKVLLKMRATFHEKHGFSLNIEGLDPSFTLGEIAKRLIEIRRLLQEKNIYNQNKNLKYPFDIQKVIVISPKNAAGLGDFQKEANVLQASGACSFFYYTAIFQGEDSEKSICETLRYALTSWSYPTPPDLIVIIRGGGSVNDLASLNNYRIAEMICKRKVPVWVGIGHQKDQTILDEVAHESFGTPSKVISGIQDILVRHATQAEDNFEYIQNTIVQRLQNQRYCVDQLKTQIHTSSSYLIYQAQSVSLRYQSLTSTYFQRHTRNHQQQVEKKYQSIVSLSKLHLVKSQQIIERFMQQSIDLGQNYIVIQNQKVNSSYNTLRMQSYHFLAQQKQLVEQNFREVLIQHPQRTLEKGYAITRINSQPLKKAQDAQDQIIDIELRDGYIQARTLSIREKAHD